MLRIPVDHFRYMFGIAAVKLMVTDRTIRSPVDKNADLTVVKPGRHRHCLQRFPAAIVGLSLGFYGIADAEG